MKNLEALLEEVLGRRPLRLRRIFTSDWAAVERAEMPGGDIFAVKHPLAGARSTTELEARMLRFLASNSELPVPEVMAVTEDLLAMTFVESGGRLDAGAQRDAARHMAKLHDIPSETFGLSFDTLYGPADQPNDPAISWVEFFRERRLLYMARQARDAGRLDDRCFARLTKLGEKLEGLIDEPAAPSLLHGDLWQGNVLVHGGKVAAFVDPAIYFGHAEMDLAFSTLFGTMSAPFFETYRTLRLIEPGFFEVRRDIYNLWPLLGHVLFFGGSYLAQVDAILNRHGV